MLLSKFRPSTASTRGMCGESVREYDKILELNDDVSFSPIINQRTCMYHLSLPGLLGAAFSEFFGQFGIIGPASKCADGLG